MMTDSALPLVRRFNPRVSVKSLCSEYVREHESHSLVTNLSEDGLRIQRPFGPGRRERDVQIEFEIPGFDEIMWAKGVTCFDQIWRAPPRTAGELSGILRTSGIHITAAAERHKRMLREYVTETWRALRAPNPIQEAIMHAACYRRG